MPHLGSGWTGRLDSMRQGIRIGTGSGKRGHSVHKDIDSSTGLLDAHYFIT